MRSKGKSMADRRYVWSSTLCARRLLATICVAVLALASSGCREREDVIAWVGDRAITQAEFDAFLKHKGLSSADPEVLERAEADYLERERLAYAIEQQSFLDEALVAAELNEFRKQMLISRYVERYLGDQVTDTALRNYYSTHPERYQTEKVRVAHILVRTNAKTDQSELEALLTRAHEVHSKLNAGEDFAELARQFSEDQLSGAKGGDLGWLKRGAIHPEFSSRVFSLKPGEVTEPFRTSFGFHIVKLIEGPEIISTPFEAVKGDIRYELRNQAKQAELAKLIASVELKQ